MAAKALVVSQTWQVHEEIGRLMAKLRAEINVAKLAGGDRESEGKKVPVVRIYRLTQQGKEADKTADQYVAAIKTFIEPGHWTDSNVAIQALSDRILVRQTPEVQRRIKNLLELLGATQT